MLRQESETKREEAMLSVRKKLGGLHKKLRGESEETSGRIKADIGLI